MECRIDINDIQKCFEFAVKYFLDPSKGSSGRTSGLSRGLGEVIDAFLGGKLAEIAVVKMLKSINPNKDYKLNFDIVPTNQVKNEPDIVKVIENGIEREPNLFLEIKRASINDRWIGLTQEQFDTMTSSAGKSEMIYVVSVSVYMSRNSYTKSDDFLGAYLKESTHLRIFDDFSGFENSYSELDTLINGSHLQKFGKFFPKGNLFFETNLFTSVTAFTRNQILNGNSSYALISTLTDSIIPPYKPYQKILIDDKNIDYPIPEFFFPLKFNGSLNLYKKSNLQSIRMFIQCLTDVTITSEMLGEFNLKKDEIYDYCISTIGRNPVLARNNIWISRSKLLSLINNENIPSPADSLKYIASKI